MKILNSFNNTKHLKQENLKNDTVLSENQNEFTSVDIKRVAGDDEPIEGGISFPDIPDITFPDITGALNSIQSYSKDALNYIATFLIAIPNYMQTLKDKDWPELNIEMPDWNNIMNPIKEFKFNPTSTSGVSIIALSVVTLAYMYNRGVFSYKKQSKDIQKQVDQIIDNHTKKYGEENLEDIETLRDLTLLKIFEESLNKKDQLGQKIIELVKQLQNKFEKKNMNDELVIPGLNRKILFQDFYMKSPNMMESLNIEELEEGKKGKKGIGITKIVRCQNPFAVLRVNDDEKMIIQVVGEEVKRNMILKEKSVVGGGNKKKTYNIDPQNSNIYMLDENNKIYNILFWDGENFIDKDNNKITKNKVNDFLDSFLKNKEEENKDHEHINYKLLFSILFSIVFLIIIFLLIAIIRKKNKKNRK